MRGGGAKRVQQAVCKPDYTPSIYLGQVAQGAEAVVEDWGCCMFMLEGAKLQVMSQFKAREWCRVGDRIGDRNDVRLCG